VWPGYVAVQGLRLSLGESEPPDLASSRASAESELLRGLEVWRSCRPGGDSVLSEYCRPAGMW